MNGNRRPINFAPIKWKKIKVVLGETRFGHLIVDDIFSDGEFDCVCDCGTRVRRGQQTLTIRKFQMCDECRREYVDEQVETRKNDRRKNTRRNVSANNQSADQE